MAAAIVNHFEVPVGQTHPVESVLLKPSGKGIFDVRADGLVIFSKYETHRHAEHQEVIDSIAALLR